jgi:hypothetical protein
VLISVIAPDLPEGILNILSVITKLSKEKCPTTALSLTLTP